MDAWVHSDPWKAVFDQMAEWSAWYSGDPERLADYYGGESRFHDRKPWWKFWGRRRTSTASQARSQLHIPLAGDISTTSASLLFSEAPRFLIPEAHGEAVDPAATQAQDRLSELVEATNLHATLLEGAEIASALGGVYLRVSWDTSTVEHPFLTIVHPDQVIPVFRWGRLMRATVWQLVEIDKNVYWRHLEHHEPGTIRHELWKGSYDKKGIQQDLNEHESTQGQEEVVSLPEDMLALTYIPNIKPNRRFRTAGQAQHLGYSDYGGQEGLLDALDEAWTSWMRDIRLGKARIIVPAEYLEVKGEATFDVDQEVFVPLEMAPDASGQNVVENQFTIRHEEHGRTVLDLVERIVTGAGYSPQTFGLQIEGRAESGTALRIRERKTLLTQQKKRRYWQASLAKAMRDLMLIDSEGGFGYVVHVEMADSIQPDPKELAETTALLFNAQAASIQERIRHIHPEWTAEQIDAEVERIQQETGMILPDIDNLS